VLNARKILSEKQKQKFNKMDIENFLNEFDENNKRITVAKLREQEAKEKQQADDLKYIADFQEHYENNIIPELEQIKIKLKDKFNLNYNDKPQSSQSSYFYTTELIPNFEHFIERIDIKIIAEGSRRLISLSGKAFGPDGKYLSNDGLHRYQDVMDAFKKINLENEITEILNKIFLKK